MFYQVFTAPSCFPLPVLLPGTFSSIGTTITTSVFASLITGNYIYSTTNNQVRKVTDIGNNGMTFTIASSFTVDVINDNLQIPDTSIIYTKASIANFDKVDGLFNGQTIFKRTVIDVDSGEIVFVIDGTGTHLGVLAT